MAALFTVLCIMTFVQTPLESYNKFISRAYASQPLPNPSSDSLAVIIGNSDDTSEVESDSVISPDSDSRNGNTNERSTFSRLMSSFDWDDYKTIVGNKNIHEIDAVLEKLIQLLQYFIILEPKVPINSECTAPVLDPPEKLNCSWKGYGTAFTGERNSDPPKIGILVQFGFGVDVLEIYLNEMYDVVDMFFIVESTKSHYRTLRKPLVWEKVKDQDRFSKFKDKITHFIIDDAQNAEVNHFFAHANTIGSTDKKIWKMEESQEGLRWMKFLEWNAAQKFFTDNDLLGNLKIQHFL